MTKSLESYTYHYLTWQVRMRSLINLADRTHTVRYNNSIIISEKEEQGVFNYVNWINECNW